MSEPNVSQDLFPALPGYTGPNAALFGFLHHDQPWEWSSDVTERVEYCRRNKLPEELAVRERHIVYLSPGALVAAGVPEAVLEEGCRLWAESTRLWAEAGRLWAESTRLWAKATRLRAESARLRNEADRLWAESARMQTEISRMRDEASRMRDEAGRLLRPYDAVITALAVSLVHDCRWDGSEIVF